MIQSLQDYKSHQGCQQKPQLHFTNMWRIQLHELPLQKLDDEFVQVIFDPEGLIPL